MTLIKSALKNILRATVPHWYWSRRMASLRGVTIEEELRLLGALTSPQPMAVDVGADEGRFSVHLLGHVPNVLTFEARPHQAAVLKEMVSTLGLPVQVEAVALSDRAGSATLRMLVMEQGRSTIDKANTLEDPDGSPRATVQVPLKRLDDYALSQVCFVKIDVEGHELAVLEGAAQTVARTRCNLLVECEDRHHAGATAALFSWMAARDYRGYFLLEDRLWPVRAFDLVLHQNPEHIGGWRSRWVRRGVYVNNFLFVPLERDGSFTAACAGLGVPLTA